MQLLRLVAKHVVPGAPLPFNVRDETGQLLLACGQVPRSQAQVLALLERGVFADVEEIKALAAGRKVPVPKSTQVGRWQRLIWSVDEMTREAKSAEFLPLCNELTQEVFALVREDPDQAIFQTVRQELQQLRWYGLSHTVHVAALCCLMVQRMGWLESKQHSLVKAALTMNMTIVDLQGRFAVHGRLTEEQRAELRKHPLEAAALLRAAGVSDELWLQAVEQHHEHDDGQGYPHGLFEVGEGAQLLRLVDVFLAKISRRESRAPLDVKEAARQAFSQWPGSPYVAALVSEYGIFPPGELVALKNGEKAVVMRRGPSLQHPLVLTLTDKRGLPCVNSIRRDTAQAEFAIVAIEKDKSLAARLPIERVYGLS